MAVCNTHARMHTCTFTHTLHLNTHLLIVLSVGSFILLLGTKTEPCCQSLTNPQFIAVFVVALFCLLPFEYLVASQFAAVTLIGQVSVADQPAWVLQELQRQKQEYEQRKKAAEQIRLAQEEKERDERRRTALKVSSFL